MITNPEEVLNLICVKYYEIGIILHAYVYTFFTLV